MTTINVNGQNFTKSLPIRKPRCFMCCAMSWRSTAPSSAAASANAAPAPCMVDGEAVYSCLLPIGRLAFARHHDRGIGHACSARARCSTPSWRNRPPNVAIASPEWSCGHRLCCRRTRSFTDDELRAHMQPNLCRCGTHMRILRAVRRAAEAMRAAEISSKHREAAPMNTINNNNLIERDAVAPSRRQVLAGGGALMVTFFARHGESAGAAAQSPPLPGSLKETPLFNSWIRVDADGSITVFTGKAELGRDRHRALAGRGRGLGPGSSASSLLPRIRPVHPMKATRRVVIPCLTALRRSATPRRRCARSCWRARLSGSAPISII